MPIMMNSDGTCSHWDWDDPVFQRRMKAGERYWPSYLGPVLEEGVKMTVFDRAVRAEPVMKGCEWLTKGRFEPTGVVSSYRIIHADGRTAGPGSRDCGATGEHAAAPPPPYTAQKITNRHGKAVLRLRFENFEELERFFMDELIGSDAMKGSASKVIGTTLLIWNRN